MASTLPMPESLVERSEPVFEVRELTPARWREFEAFFARYDGVQAGCWCMYYHREGPNGPLESGGRQASNRRDHQRLLERGRAHGVLVFDGRRAVGWCQFGRRGDLPRIERGRKYAEALPELGTLPEWRITCFFVDRPYRHRGVARRALHGALAAIARLGGGTVEAYPALHRRAVATWFGSRSMFEREGFRVVRPFGRSNVLMRKDLPRAAPRGRQVPPTRGRGPRNPSARSARA